MDALPAEDQGIEAVVLAAMDQIFLTLEQQQSEDLAPALHAYIQHLRDIEQAASARNVRGLHWVCRLIEGNLQKLLEQQRVLSQEELHLLREWPDLLASYALDHGERNIQPLLKHLAEPCWPEPLNEHAQCELHQLLSCDDPACVSLQSETDDLPLLTEVISSVSPPLDFEQIETFIAGLTQTPVLVAAVLQQLDVLLANLSQTELMQASLQQLRDSVAQQASQLELSKPQVQALQDASLLILESIHGHQESLATQLFDLAFAPCWQTQEVTEAENSGPVTTPQPDPAVALTATASNSLSGCEIKPASEVVNRQLLQIFSHELQQMLPQLEQDLDKLQQSVSDSDYALHTVNYLDDLSRIADTAASLSLTGVQLFLANLVQLVAGADIKNPERQLELRLIPLNLVAYLEALAQDQVVSEFVTQLISHLQHPVWQNVNDDTTLSHLQHMLSNIEVSDEHALDEEENRDLSSVSLALPSDLNYELFEGLLQELPQQLDQFSSALLAIQTGMDIQNGLGLLEQAQRAAHTLKGAANTVGIAGIANLTHHLEELLQQQRQAQQLPDNELLQLLIQAGDCLQVMGEAILGVSPPPSDAGAIMQAILAAIAGVTTTTSKPDLTRGAVTPVHKLSDNKPALSAPDISGALPVTEPELRKDLLANESQLRVSEASVDELLRLAGENLISNSQIQEQLKQTLKQTSLVQQQDQHLQKLVEQLEHLVDIRGFSLQSGGIKTPDGFDPLEFERYNELHTITRQLLEARTDAQEMNLQMQQQLHHLSELLEGQRHLQVENEHAVLRTRLVPVSQLSARLQRVVRQTCRVTGKQAQLLIEGEQTQIDSKLLHELADPLMHILRNAIDHGIESQEQRQLRQKPLQGCLKLSFSRAGNNLRLICQDDGAGLDFAAIQHKALAKGLLSPQQTLSENELARFILLPGFSTRNVTTQTSGRGIGMDVVYERILQLKGSIEIHSVSAQGLSLVIQLPLSLLSEHVLLARVNQSLLALSSRRIQDIHYHDAQQLLKIGERELYRYQKANQAEVQLLPLYDLPQLLGLARQAREPKAILLVRQQSGDLVAIKVDELSDSREVVVKKLGPYVPRLPGIIGAALLGDGSVSPVLDLADLLEQRQPQKIAWHEQIGGQADASTAQSSDTYTVLVVDDSLSARRTTAQIVRDAGFQVHTALDGLDAIQKINEVAPDLLLVDMEMPRMNGLELTAHIRARSWNKPMSIIMITSRSSEKHRQQALQAGVDDYLVKPFNEDQLLQRISSYAGVCS